MATKVRKAGDMLSPHFSKAEMRCRCRRSDCDAKPMVPRFITKLEALRLQWVLPLIPTSAARCEYWNRKVGGAPQSQHLLGIAADFWFADPVETAAFVQLAEKIGFGGIGFGSHLVHLDDRDLHARWGYRD